MELLPEIVNGVLQEDKLDKELKKFNKNFISTERKRKLAENLAKIKAKHLEKDLEKVESEMSKLNNMGHNKVKEDFSDSPHLK